MGQLEELLCKINIFDLQCCTAVWTLQMLLILDHDMQIGVFFSKVYKLLI